VHRVGSSQPNACRATQGHRGNTSGSGPAPAIACGARDHLRPWPERDERVLQLQLPRSGVADRVACACAGRRRGRPHIPDRRPSAPLKLGWSAEDLRLGILLRSVALEEVDRSVRTGETIVFTERSGAERLLGEGWSALGLTGVWTDGEKASLILRLTDVPPADVELVSRGLFLRDARSSGARSRRLGDIWSESRLGGGLGARPSGTQSVRSLRTSGDDCRDRPLSRIRVFATVP
jgi:hypothetical protein